LRACWVSTKAGDKGAACAETLSKAPIVISTATIYLIGYRPFHTPFLDNFMIYITKVKFVLTQTNTFAILLP
jgi:hypothetical protein